MALLYPNMLPKYLRVDFMRNKVIFVFQIISLASRLLALTANDVTFPFHLDNAMAADVLAIVISPPKNQRG